MCQDTLRTSASESEFHGFDYEFFFSDFFFNVQRNSRELGIRERIPRRARGARYSLNLLALLVQKYKRQFLALLVQKYKN
jgi:hypothetical protein